MHHAKKGHRVISMDILEHLQKLYPALTKKQKTIADYLIANPEEISYITLAAKPSDRYLRADFASFLSKTGVLQLSGLKGAVSGLYPKND